MSFNELSAPDINVVFFAQRDINNPDMLSMARDADLVVALGNVDLDAFAAALPHDKPALCVMGSGDAEQSPPAPFKPLHGGGVTFRDWRVAGLSGAKRTGPGAGFLLGEEEAHVLLDRMPACDLLITHAPPAGLPGTTSAADRGFEALTQYLREKPPIYHFYAHAGPEHKVDQAPETLVIGVSGFLFPPALRFN